MDKTLLSVPELVDADCNVNFNKKGVVVIDKNTEQMILKGRRDPATRLWLIPIVQQPIKLQHQFKFKIPTIDVPHTVNSTYQQRTVSKLIQFLHATAGSPPVKTWCKAINNNYFITWSGLTSQAVQKHLPKSEATSMGHLHMLRKSIRPTKPTIEEIMEEELEPEPVLEPPRNNKDRKHYVGIKSFKFEELKGISATDLQGQFPITSAHGNSYVMVMFDTDSNAIQDVPI
jgi:hypothetical protein